MNRSDLGMACIHNAPFEQCLSLLYNVSYLSTSQDLLTRIKFTLLNLETIK